MCNPVLLSQSTPMYSIPNEAFMLTGCDGTTICITNEIFAKFCPQYAEAKKHFGGHNVSQIHMPISSLSLSFLEKIFNSTPLNLPCSLMPLLELLVMSDIWNSQKIHLACWSHITQAEHQAFQDANNDLKWTLQALACLANTPNGPLWQSKGLENDWEEELREYHTTHVDLFYNRDAHLASLFGKKYFPTQRLYDGAIDGQRDVNSNTFHVTFPIFQRLLTEKSLAGIALRVISKTHPVHLILETQDFDAFIQLAQEQPDQIAQSVDSYEYSHENWKKYGNLLERKRSNPRPTSLSIKKRNLATLVKELSQPAIA